MDIMLIRWIIVLFGVSVGSSITIENNNSTATSKNNTETATSLTPNYDSEQNSKPKRELDEFEFDTSTFDDLPSIFPVKKINGLSSFDDEEVDDISAFIPTSSFKVTRSNSESLGTHGQNFESPNLSSLSYRSDSQPAQQTNNAQANLYSNEDQDALSQVRQSNTAYNNQVTTPLYIDSYVAQPKYIAAKSSAFPSENPYKAPSKVQFNPYPALAEFTSSLPMYGPLTQVSVQPIGSSHHHQVQQSASQNTAYKTPNAQGFKNLRPDSRVYAPSHNHNQPQQFDTQFQNFANNNPYGNIQYTTTPGLDLNSKKLELPVLQLQTAQNYPGYIQALETTPIIFSAESGLRYKADPGFGVSFDFTKPKNINPNQRSGTNAPFLGTANPVQVLPVQTASSTAQFPKFKGASIAQFPSRGFSKIPNDYQEFTSQTQLHFNGNPNNKPKSYHKPAFYNKPLEEIRTDVEVIDKKKPIPPLPKAEDDDEDESADSDSGEGFKKTDSYFPKNEDDDDDDVEPLPKKFFKESDLEGDFKPSKSFPFNEYDGKFSKQKKVIVNDDDNDDDEDANVNLAAKYRYLAKSEDDDDDEDEKENESAEDKPKSKYKAYPLHENFQSNRSNEDDDEEEETQKQERREKDADREQHTPRKSKSQKERSKSYADEFEESFRRKHSKPKFSHHRSKSSKASRESEESRPRLSASYSAPKSSKKSRHRAYRDESGESSSRPTSGSSLSGQARQAFKREQRPEDGDKTTSGNSRGSRASPQVVWQDSYGMRIGDPDEDTSTYSKEEAAVTDGYGNARNKPTASSSQDFATTRSSQKSTTQRPTKKSNVAGIESGATSASSTFSPRGNGWKSASVKIKPIAGESYSRPAGSGLRALVNTKQTYFSPVLGRGEVFRSLKGV